MNCGDCLKRFSCPFDQSTGGTIFKNTEIVYPEKTIEHKFISLSVNAADASELSCVKQKEYKYNSMMGTILFNPSTEEFDLYLNNLCKIIEESTEDV